MIVEALLLPAILGSCILMLKLSPFPGFGETFRSIVASDAAANFAFDFVFNAFLVSLIPGKTLSESPDGFPNVAAAPGGARS